LSAAAWRRSFFAAIPSILCSIETGTWMRKRQLVPISDYSKKFPPSGFCLPVAVCRAVQSPTRPERWQGAESEHKGRLFMAQDVIGQSMQSRVDRMFQQDKMWAWGFVIALWITLAFVYFATIGYVEDGSVKVVIGIAALILGGLNTASIGAMISHYSHDKKSIYELDIKHLDAMKGGGGH
jgi:hypothetical protein